MQVCGCAAAGALHTVALLSRRDCVIQPSVDAIGFTLALIPAFSPRRSKIIRRLHRKRATGLPKPTLSVHGPREVGRGYVVYAANVAQDKRDSRDRGESFAAADQRFRSRSNSNCRASWWQGARAGNKGHRASTGQERAKRQGQRVLLLSMRRFVGGSSGRGLVHVAVAVSDLFRGRVYLGVVCGRLLLSTCCSQAVN